MKQRSKSLCDLNGGFTFAGFNLCHMSRRFWKLFELLPPLCFAKLDFSEVVYIWILFRASLPPYRIDYCCIGGMTGVYFLVYSPMVHITSLPTDMNGLWIDRWYMRQDWIRPALATAAITSLFYLENCKKIKDFTPAIDPWLERLSWTTSFFYGEKTQKITDCNKARTVWTGGAWRDLKLIYDHP